jgi:hypothetical protein
MRARFTVDELMNPAPAMFRLTVPEQVVLRQRMRGYLSARLIAPESGPALQ